MTSFFTASLPGPFSAAVETVRTALAKQGFGIITEIDVAATLKKKLDVSFKQYVILGACNPGFAHRALSTNDLVGLLLPCNVIVYAQDDGRIAVATMRPTVLLNVLADRAVCAVGQEAEVAMERVFASLVS